MPSLLIGPIFYKTLLTAALALATAGHASASAFEIITRSTGTGSFNMEGMFDASGPSWVTGPYTMQITATVNDPVLYQPRPTRQIWTETDANVQIKLEVGGNIYWTEQDHRYMTIDYAASAGETSLTQMSVYVDLWPSRLGNYAPFVQSMVLQENALAFSDTLTPVALATPEVLAGSVDAGVYFVFVDVFHQVGAITAHSTENFYSVTAVPEPAMFSLTLLGCATVAGAAMLRARRRER